MPTAKENWRTRVCALTPGGILFRIAHRPEAGLRRGTGAQSDRRNTVLFPRFVQSTRDQYGPAAELAVLAATLPEPKKLVFIKAQDHFFAEALEKLEDEIASPDSKPLG
jgi:alpha/beta superfamily hydrolase